MTVEDVAREYAEREATKIPTRFSCMYVGFKAGVAWQREQDADSFARRDGMILERDRELMAIRKRAREAIHRLEDETTKGLLEAAQTGSYVGDQQAEATVACLQVLRELAGEGE